MLFEQISGTWGAEVLGFVVRSCSSLTRQRMAGEVWQKSHAVRQSSWVLLSNCNKFLDIVPSSKCNYRLLPSQGSVNAKCCNNPTQTLA
ncbi:hypothetical protein V6N11_082085 [Hibiscus sabdariffa]|uniref:Uncharacterized protein n=1 Tax=Hibiscus sabdariffa TaxID=183260 RepID=A0ABR2QHH7_9ROSI